MIEEVPHLNMWVDPMDVEGVAIARAETDSLAEICLTTRAGHEHKFLVPRGEGDVQAEEIVAWIRRHQRPF